MTVAVEDASEVEAPQASRSRFPKPDLGWLLLAMGGALVLAAIVLKVWDGLLHVPFYLTGDVGYQLLLIKTVMTHGWLGINHDIGAPYGGVIYDHTVAYGDTVQLLIIKLLGYGSSDPVAVMNVFFMLTFALVSGSAFVVLRALGFSAGISTACAIAYALLPYHFARNEAHLFLVAYFSVPVGCWLVLGTMGRLTLFERREGARSRWLAWSGRRSLITVAACAFVGTAEVYYAVFTALLVIICVFTALLAQRRLATVIPGIAVCVMVLGAAVLVQAPTIIYHHQHGANPEVGKRVPQESETYGIKFAELVLPGADHRFGPARDIGQKYFPVMQLKGEADTVPLGLLMTLGFLLALAAAAAAMAGRVVDSPRQLLIRDSGIAIGAALALASIGGFSTLIAYYLSPQIRGWERISVFIGFFALIGFASILTWLKEHMTAPPRRYAFGGLLLLVPIFAAWDQSARHIAPDYKGGAATWRSDAHFVQATQALLPKGASVLQLPYVPFPENPPVNQMQDYDELKGYEHSSTLRWSYGAIKGRDPDQWGEDLAGMKTSRMVPAAVAAGFSAIYIDTFGFADGGTKIVTELTKVLGEQASVRSEDGRLLLFNLAPMAQRLTGASAADRQAASDALVRPVVTDWSTGFYTGEASATDTWHWAQSTAKLTLDNSAQRTRTVSFRFGLKAPGQRQHVDITLPGGKQLHVLTRPGKVTSERVALTLPHGTSTVSFSTDAPDDGVDPRDLRLQVFNADFDDAGLETIVRDER